MSSLMLEGNGMDQQNTSAEAKSVGGVIMAADTVNEDRCANQDTLTRSDWWLSFFQTRIMDTRGQTKPRLPHTAKYIPSITLNSSFLFIIIIIIFFSPRSDSITDRLLQKYRRQTLPLVLITY